MTEEDYVKGVEEMRGAASEKKAIVALYNDDNDEAYAALKAISKEEKEQLAPWVKIYDKYAEVLGEALHKMRSSEDGEPFVEGVVLNTNYKVKVTDESAVPRLFMKVDEAKIKAAVKAMKGTAPPINGVEITETHKLAVKTEG